MADVPPVLTNVAVILARISMILLSIIWGCSLPERDQRCHHKKNGAQNTSSHNLPPRLRIHSEVTRLDLHTIFETRASWKKSLRSRIRDTVANKFLLQESP